MKQQYYLGRTKRQVFDVESYAFEDAEHLRLGSYPVIDTLMQRWARRMENVFYDLLGLELHTGVSTAQLLRFSRFFYHIRSPRPFYISSLNRFQGLLCCDNAFAEVCLRAGAGEEPPSMLNPANQLRLKKVVEEILQAFNASMEKISSEKARLEKMTTMPFRARIFGAYEPCVVVQAHLSGAAGAFRLTFCFPLPMLEKIQAKGRPRVIPSLYPGPSMPERSPLSYVQGLSYTLQVSLGEVSFAQLCRQGLREGDILPFTPHVSEKPVVTINGQKSFLGALGQEKAHHWLKIDQPYPTQNLPQSPWEEARWPLAQS